MGQRNPRENPLTYANYFSSHAERSRSMTCICSPCAPSCRAQSRHLPATLQHEYHSYERCTVMPSAVEAPASLRSRMNIILMNDAPSCRAQSRHLPATLQHEYHSYERCPVMPSAVEAPASLRSSMNIIFMNDA